MKYRLKKDLPFAKAGKEVSFTEMQIVIQMDDPCHKIYYGRNDLAYLLSEGWIEKVKPREFWVPMENGRILESNCPFDEEYNKNWLDGIEVIKVREIIE